MALSCTVFRAVARWASRHENMDKLRAADGAVHCKKRGLVGRIFRLDCPDRGWYIGAVRGLPKDFSVTAPVCAFWCSAAASLMACAMVNVPVGLKRVGVTPSTSPCSWATFSVGMIQLNIDTCQRQRWRRAAQTLPLGSSPARAAAQRAAAAVCSTGCDRSCHVFSFFR